jgi:pimeloyl-ACP methyl ester carboxylesterase
MVHGAGGGGWEWSRWRAVFEAQGWQVDAPDLQACTAGLEATGLADYLDQLQAHCAKAPPSALVGASLGGLLCLSLAESQPGVPLLLVNPLPPLPEAAALPERPRYPARVPWSSAARYAATHEAMAEAACSARLFAFRRWRDESGRVLNDARRGWTVAVPASPCLLIASQHDGDTPIELSAALALRLRASLLRLPGGHLAPLLGDLAHQAAGHAVAWLNTVLGFRAN